VLLGEFRKALFHNGSAGAPKDVANEQNSH
jgi:hypothetical protein